MEEVGLIGGEGGRCEDAYGAAVQPRSGVDEEEVGGGHPRPRGTIGEEDGQLVRGGQWEGQGRAGMERQTVRERGAARRVSGVVAPILTRGEQEGMNGEGLDAVHSRDRRATEQQRLMRRGRGRRERRGGRGGWCEG